MLSRKKLLESTRLHVAIMLLFLKYSTSKSCTCRIYHRIYSVINKFRSVNLVDFEIDIGIGTSK